MPSLVSRHQPQIPGILSGFDRLRFLGTLRRLSFLNGLASFLAVTSVLLKDFGDSGLPLSRRIKQASERLALTTPSGRGHDLASRAQSQEDFVPPWPTPTHPGPSGLIAVRSGVEPCRS
jgi:hypothetical protein